MTKVANNNVTIETRAGSWTSSTNNYLDLSLTLGCYLGGRSANAYTSSEVHKVIVDNETFNFKESSGTTTIGSEGTVATINTTHASGTDYINDNVWNLGKIAVKDGHKRGPNGR